MSAIIIARDLAFAFANGRELFSNLSLSLEPQLTGLVGPNGVGKTHLARVLAGEITPSAGTVIRKVPVRLFPQRHPPPSLTVAEFLANADEWSLPRARLLENIETGALCTNLSGGEWMRVRLARTLGDQFLILDEPTNDLDAAGRHAVTQFLLGHRSGALLISHDRESLRLCGQILELSNRGLAKFGADFPAYSEAREQERERLGAALRLAKRERDQALAKRAEQKARQDKRNRHAAASAARGGMPRLLLGARKRRAQQTSAKLDLATLARAQSAIQEAHTALSNLKVDPIMYADWVGQPLPAQKLVAEAAGFNIRLKDWIYPTDLDFTWRGNVRVLVRGSNGSGKSTLLRTLLGASQAGTRGRLCCGELVSLYLDQHCSSLQENQSVLDNIRAVSNAREREIRNDLARFLFTGDSVFQAVHELSGGERLRAALARGLLGARAPELMVLDEPTNNLDLANVEFLENVVREFRGALVVVSHDVAFVENCSVTEELSVGTIERPERRALRR